MASSLTRVVTFHARHRFWVPEWTEEENRARFGWTSEAPGHGHAYQCSVTVSGPLDPVRGTVTDLPLLDRLIEGEVLVLDGAHLNLDIPEFAYGRTLPTCEALAAWAYGRLARRLPPGLALERVRISEDQTLHGDCTGLG